MIQPGTVVAVVEVGATIGVVEAIVEVVPKVFVEVAEKFFVFIAAGPAANKWDRSIRCSTMLWLCLELGLVEWQICMKSTRINMAR